MDKKSDDPKEIKYALSDFWRICSKAKKGIILTTLACALGLTFLALWQPVYYSASASFRDKGKPHSSFGSLTDFFFSSAATGSDSESISTLRSRKLLSKVVRSLGLQGTLAKYETRYPDLEDIRDNILAEFAYWRSLKVPVLKEQSTPLKLHNLVYDGELIKGIVIHFTDETHFKVLGHEETGEIGTPFKTHDLSFTLLASDIKPSFKDTYYVLSVFPMELAVKIYGAFLVIDVDREDKTLLKLQYRHRNRHMASAFLNQLMATYQDHLKEDQEYISSFQLSYLNSRQKELGSGLQDLLERHASRISEDLSMSGFMDSEREMQFLASNFHELQQKLTEIDFENKRLQHLSKNDFVHYDQYGGRGDSSIINTLLGEIRNLRLQIDLLDLSLEKREKRDDVALKTFLEEQFNELHETRERLKVAQELAADLKLSEANSAHSKADSSQYLASVWKKSLNEISFPAAEEESFKEHYLGHLENLIRLLQLKEATLQERIKHQHNPKGEFHGITLETVRNLFYAYTKEINDIQALIKQHQFVIEELKNPDFEVCSLTALLTDPISAERISKASVLLLNLKDENNRTQKEMQRTREELELLKKFLRSHLEQMVELFNLKEELLQDKNYALQSVALDLSHQQIYVLKKQLADYLNTRLENLAQEKRMIKDHQIELSLRMAKLPSRWASEKIVSQHLATHQKFLENLSSMVESKNIAKNLEMIQSLPLDGALPSVNPNHPKAVIWAILGALCGFLGSIGFIVGKSLVKGVAASPENLALADLNCSGFVSSSTEDKTPYLDSDLNTLRHALAFFEQRLHQPTAKKILLLLGKGPDCSLSLINLIAKKGEKTLEMSLAFNKSTPEKDLPGLLQYLEGDVESPKINHERTRDFISAGGHSRFSSELLRKASFRELLNQYEATYNWIIGVAECPILSAEAINLSLLFDGIIVVSNGETIEELQKFSQETNPLDEKALTFILT